MFYRWSKLACNLDHNRIPIILVYIRTHLWFPVWLDDFDRMPCLSQRRCNAFFFPAYNSVYVLQYACITLNHSCFNENITGLIHLNDVLSVLSFHFLCVYIDGHEGQSLISIFIHCERYVCMLFCATVAKRQLLACGFQLQQTYHHQHNNCMHLIAQWNYCSREFKVNLKHSS